MTLTQSETMTQSEMTTQSETMTESDMMTQSEMITQTEMIAQTGRMTQSEEIMTKTTTGAVTHMMTETVTHPEMLTDIVTQSEMVTQAKMMTQAETVTSAVTHSEMMTQSETMTQSEMMTETITGVVTQSDMMTQSEMTNYVVTQSEMMTKTITDVVTDSITGTEEAIKTTYVGSLKGQNSTEISSSVFSSFTKLLVNTSTPSIGTPSSAAPSANLSTWPLTSYDVFNLSNITEINIQNDAINDDIDSSTTIKMMTLVVLTFVGVVGNGLVIWSVVRQRHLHRPPFYYLLSLSLTDLSRAAFCLPLVLMTVVQGSAWHHGAVACDLFAFANTFFALNSAVSLLDIAVDRHLSLVYSTGYRRRSGGAVNLLVVLLGWALAFLVAFPPVIGVGAYAFEESEGQCTLKHKFYRQDNDTLGFLMVFTVLMFVTLFVYYRIFLALRAHRKMRPLDHQPARSATWTFVGPGANGQAWVNWVNGFGARHFGNIPNPARNPPRPNIARRVDLHVAKNHHVTRLFFIMTLAFDILWLPYQVLSYWRVFGQPENIEVTFVTVAAWLSYGQVVLCPVVYFSSRGSVRSRPSRTDISPQDKQQFLLEAVTRKK